MIKKIKENIFQLYFRNFGSCVYYVKIKNNNIIIDTGSSLNKSELINDLQELKIAPEEIDTLILTHSHYDHTGNVDLFKNAKIYASKLEFSEKNIMDIHRLNINEFKIIKTPGHSKGSFCILYGDVLFSGDTIFHNGGIGRMDLEGGSEEEMFKSLKVLEKIPYKILLPGHI